MKPIIPICTFASIASLAAGPLSEPAAEADVLPDPAAIRFTPPPPPMEVPAIKVRDATSADFGTHRVTILRGEASTLPDIPEPLPPAEPGPEAVAEAPGSAEALFISVSTYGDSLSRVEIWNPATNNRHTAWCGWDVSLIAPMHEIFHQGKSRLLLMGIGPGPDVGDRPEVEPWSILVPDGDEFTASVLTSLRDACFRNLPKLRELKTAREQYQKDAAAWRAANPPRPQDHTIWLKPHRGSRYLKSEPDANTEGGR